LTRHRISNEQRNKFHLIYFCSIYSIVVILRNEGSQTATTGLSLFY
jgi:hypothetical protein